MPDTLTKKTPTGSGGDDYGECPVCGYPGTCFSCWHCSNHCCCDEYHRDIRGTGRGCGDESCSEVRVNDPNPFTPDQLIAFYIGVAVLVAAVIAAVVGVA